MAKKSIQKIEDKHVFVCSCDKKEEFSQADFVTHLKTDHGLTTREELTAKKTMTMHMNGGHYAIYEYSGEMPNGLMFYEYHQFNKKSQYN